jgi:nickel transport protein
VNRSARLPILLLLLTGLAVPVVAHEVQQKFFRAEASVLRLTYEDGSPFSYEQYELFFEDEEIPRQVGRTDADGHVVFLPHRSGRWRVKVFSADGHGVVQTLITGPADGDTTEQEPTGRGQKLVTGIAVIFGVFGLMTLFLRRRSSS